MAGNGTGIVTIEGAGLIYRNFSGLEGEFNSAGDRNFCVILDEPLAERLANAGWNVRRRKPREEGDPDLLFLKVNVKYRSRDGRRMRPPRIVMITSKGKVTLTERTINHLDWATFTNVDLMIRPWEHRNPGGAKYSAYLDTLFVTLFENELEMKYLDVPDSAQTAMVAGNGGPETEVPF